MGNKEGDEVKGLPCELGVRQPDGSVKWVHRVIIPVPGQMPIVEYYRGRLFPMNDDPPFKTSGERPYFKDVRVEYHPPKGESK